MVRRTLQSLPTITTTPSRLNLISAAKLHEENPEELVQIQHPRRFPYSIYYRMEGNEVVVLGVLHIRRDPKEWQSRA